MPVNVHFESVICLLSQLQHVSIILNNVSLSVDPIQTAPTVAIRLLLQQQSDVGLHCVSKRLH